MAERNKLCIWVGAERHITMLAGSLPPEDGSDSRCLGYVSVKSAANFSFAVRWPTLTEDLIAPLAKPVAHHLLGRVVRSCESSPAGPGTQCRRQVHVRREFEGEEEYLEILGITREQSGKYECKAANEVASADVKQVRVTVNYPPTITESKSNEAATGRQALLRCEASAVPTPDFEWYRDDTRINSANGLEIKSTGTQSLLMVANVTEEHYGNYTCVAANKLGVTNASLYLYSKPADNSTAKCLPSNQSLSRNLSQSVRGIQQALKALVWDQSTETSSPNMTWPAKDPIHLWSPLHPGHWVVSHLGSKKGPVKISCQSWGNHTINRPKQPVLSYHDPDIETTTRGK
ncbi:Lsamp [Columba guinea]|nr:Lsamp [Columba guinea]